MWALLPPEVTRLLGHHHANGAFTGQPASAGRPADAWVELSAELDTYRHLADDYDGQGAVAPTSEIVDGAIELLGDCRRLGLVPPSCVVAGVNGTVSLEWDLPNRQCVTIEVTGRHTAEVFLIALDQHSASWVLGPALTA